MGPSSHGAEHSGQRSQNRQRMYVGTIIKQGGGGIYPMLENAHGGDRVYIGPVSVAMNEKKAKLIISLKKSLIIE